MRTGYREFVARWSEVWGADWRVEPTELIDLGECAVLFVDQPVHGQASGVPITQKLAVIATWRDGLVINQQEYFDQAEALEAAGLQE